MPRSASQPRLEVIDLGAGHSSGRLSQCGRIVGALKSAALVNDSVGAGSSRRDVVVQENPLLVLRDHLSRGAGNDAFVFVTPR